jgi:hypothetical protein
VGWLLIRCFWVEMVGGDGLRSFRVKKRPPVHSSLFCDGYSAKESNMVLIFEIFPGVLSIPECLQRSVFRRCSPNDGCRSRARAMEQERHLEENAHIAQLVRAFDFFLLFAQFLVLCRCAHVVVPSRMTGLGPGLAESSLWLEEYFNFQFHM